VLAAAGIGSRRQCEELIRTGRVEVDRKVVTELGTRVDPARSEIRVDGTALAQTELACYAVHKPPGVVSTSRDPAGRTRVIDLAPAGDRRLFAVGRLDLHSEGLILVTNDGELAHRLTHPRFGVPKTYRVLVAGRTTHEVLQKLLRGIYLAEGVARVRKVTVRRHHKKSTLLEMVLDEGQNREIRRVLARVGHKVLRLMRIAVGPVRLGTLPPGACRRLSRQEVDALWRAVRGRVTGKTKGQTEPRDVPAR
jgi:23S rRNA pseudouridine2605 synthase